MKPLLWLVWLALLPVPGLGQTAEDRESLMKTTAAIRDAFGRGDVAAVVALHHPTVVKYFGGTNVVNGRVELERGLVETFRNSRMKFIENDVESTLFHGDTAVETSIFAIKVMFKDGRPSVVTRGRAMVVYVKYKDSPTGWASIREMTQAAPQQK
jgi:ketosteroid isomerase-like protein